MSQSNFRQRRNMTMALDHSHDEHDDHNSPITREMLKELEKIDINPHVEPKSFGDKMANGMVQFIKRFAVEMPFKTRPLHQALAMETLGVVPGFVLSGYHRIRSIITRQPCKWEHPALQEGLRERWHLYTWMYHLFPHNLFGRMFARAQVGMWVMLYTPFYVMFPRTAHRFLGYLEEMATDKYTEILSLIDTGKLENHRAPEIAINHWKLPADATIRDVILVIRADEADHRELHHHLSNLCAEVGSANAFGLPCNRLEMNLAPIESHNLHLPEHATSRVKFNAAEQYEQVDAEKHKHRAHRTHEKEATHEKATHEKEGKLGKEKHREPLYSGEKSMNMAAGAGATGIGNAGFASGGATEKVAEALKGTNPSFTDNAPPFTPPSAAANRPQMQGSTSPQSGVSGSRFEAGDGRQTQHSPTSATGFGSSEPKRKFGASPLVGEDDAFAFAETPKGDLSFDNERVDALPESSEVEKLSLDGTSAYHPLEAQLLRELGGKSMITSDTLAPPDPKQTQYIFENTSDQAGLRRKAPTQ